MDNFDVVVPVGPNDVSVIHRQLDHVKKNVIGYREIYLVTPDPILKVDGCITIDEKLHYPFNKQTVAEYHGKLRRNGWYYQQLLKLYAGFCIPGILERYLVIDSDTFFMKPTKFVRNGKCMFNWGTEYHKSYFEHMKRIHPGLVRVDPAKSGICHNMIFETKYLRQLFDMVEKKHKDKFYNVFLKLITDKEKSGASEYEIYFNYMCKFHWNDILLRKLKWANVGELKDYPDMNYVSYHSYLRNKKI